MVRDNGPTQTDVKNQTFSNLKLGRYTFKVSMGNNSKCQLQLGALW